MGKRNGGLTGLSRFVLESFNNDPASHPSDIDDRPVKKRKTTNEETVKESSSRKAWSEPQWIQKYDATGLVPHYTHPSQVPLHLQKYFSQRTRLLSLYSTLPGCLLDEEGWYSITPELIADQIAERCRCDTILDAFCGVGGNAIAFAKTCQRVIALDTSPTRLALARHNAQIYGVADRIEFILTDYIAFANAYLSLPSSPSSPHARKIDVIFLSPPWGGPSYLSPSSDSLSHVPDPSDSPSNPNPNPTPPQADYTLASIQPIHGADLFHLSRRITRNVAYYLPRNVALDEVAGLLSPATTATTNGTMATAPNKMAEPKEEREWDHGKPTLGVDAKGEGAEMVEVEEEWMGTKLKAVACYFGGLVGGQEGLF